MILPLGSSEISIPANNYYRYTFECLAEILKYWDKQLVRTRPEIFIQGSPERAEFRIVIEDQQNKCFVLEQIAAGKVAHKKSIADDLLHFAGKGLPVPAYLRGSTGETIQKYQDEYWQLMPFIEGITLDREQYWRDEWRGQAAAKFIIQLREHSQHKDSSVRPFSIVEFITEIMSKIQKDRPGLYQELIPIVDTLKQQLFPVYGRIPVGYCHGDAHPLNMIWGEDSILAVIDWEFSGIKQELYDIALIIGCVGSESPEARHAGFVRAFRQYLIDQGVLNDQSLKLLSYLILAERFGWLSEWLRRDDEQMLTQELYYMTLLRKEIT